MPPTSLTAALAGLLHLPLTQFEGLNPHLPHTRPWWPDAQAWQAAAWANELITAGLTHHPTLYTQHHQRTPIFSHLFTATNASFIPLETLDLTEETLFPQSHPLPPPARQAAYEHLLQSLAAGLQASSSLDNATTYLLHLYDLLQKTTWCLPAPYTDHPTFTQPPGTSLFDHSRVLAALAPCYTAAQSQPGEAAATLISGDISGVQTFIYTITARGAIRGLRGRSFYLQLLTEAIAAYLLHQLALPPTSLLYAGGGHFFLIAPPDTTPTQVQACQHHISHTLLRHHQGQLYLALGTATFTQKDFQPAHFSPAWSRLSQAVSQAKRQRFSELGQAMYDTLFVPTGQGGAKEHECRVCHYEAASTQHLVPEDEVDEAGDPIYKCHLCHSLEQLGNALRKAQYLLLERVSPPIAPRHKWHTALNDFGLSVKVLDDLSGLDPATTADHSLLWALNDTAYTQAQPHLTGSSLPLLRHYLVNVTPLVTQADQECYYEADDPDRPQIHDVKPFGLLQRQAEGISRIGVLRMDVDDLGDLFARGFGTQGGLVKTAALSFALSLYFEGWVGQLAAAASSQRHVVYSIYSGGDDLFIVGAWDVLLGLAHEISIHFKRYAAANPRLHLSAGLTLHGGKFPLYQAAKLAEDALEQAKSFSQPSHHKDAFTFLDRTYAWSDYDKIHGEFAILCQLMASGAPHSLLQHLSQLDTLYHQHRQIQLDRLPEEKAETAVYWGPWHWHSAYQLTRLAQQNQKIQQEIHALRQRLQGENFHHIHYLGLAARWTELYTRQTDKQQEGG